MNFLSIIVVSNNVVVSLDTFQLSKDLVEDAENFFLEKIREFLPYASVDRIEEVFKEALEDGFFETNGGTTISLVQS